MPLSSRSHGPHGGTFESAKRRGNRGPLRSAPGGLLRVFLSERRPVARRVMAGTDTVRRPAPELFWPGLSTGGSAPPNRGRAASLPGSAYLEPLVQSKQAEMQPTAPMRPRNGDADQATRRAHQKFEFSTPP